MKKYFKARGENYKHRSVRKKANLPDLFITLRDTYECI